METTWTPVPNMGAGLTGYDPVIADKLLKGAEDPGKRDQIFEATHIAGDGRVYVNNFIDFRSAKECVVNGQTQTIRKRIKDNHKINIEFKQDLQVFWLLVLTVQCYSFR